MKRSAVTLTVAAVATAGAVVAAAGVAGCSAPAPAPAPAPARTAPASSRGAALHWGSYFGDRVAADAARALSPARVSLPAAVKQLATSNSTQYALLTDGQVWAWGQGTHGQLGDGGDANSFTAAVRVRFPPGVTIAFLPYDAQPYDSALAVDTAGRAWGWGLNLRGEFCDGGTEAAGVPVRIPLPGTVTALAGANSHAVYDAGGTVYACGSNYAGVAGTGTTAVKRYYRPVPVAGLPSGVAVRALVSAFADAGALLADGQFYDWGYDAQGQLGNGVTTARPAGVPQRVPLPGRVAQVYEGGSAAGNGQTLVMLSDGALYAWGAGALGQLGTGHTADEDSPVPFRPPAGVTYKTLATGGATGYAIDTGGNLWAWGAGGTGELGNGRAGDSLIPVKVVTGAAMVSATAGDAVAAAGPG